MNKRTIRVKTALAAVLFASLCIPSVAGAEHDSSLIRSEVIKRDSRGRVEMMKTRAGNGACVAEIVYDKVPRIYVVVASRVRLQNIGYLQINDGTEENLSDETLMKNFRKAIGEHCLPLIVPGFVAI